MNCVKHSFPPSFRNNWPRSTRGDVTEHTEGPIVKGDIFKPQTCAGCSVELNVGRLSLRLGKSFIIDAFVNGVTNQGSNCIIIKVFWHLALKLPGVTRTFAGGFCRRFELES